MLALRRFFIASALLAATSTAPAATWYVAPDGSDVASGSLAQPFGSITRAQQAAASGDTVYLRGGTYTSFTVASQDTTYQYVLALSKSGIRYLAQPGDSRPVLDFSAISPDTKRVCGILLSGSNNTIEGIDVTGIRAGAQKQADNWRISGSGNTLRRVVTRDDQGNGLYLLGNASNNLIENCDSYNLVGVSGTSAGNTDGFGCHSAGSGNVFRGDRAWGNSDDGFDCISNSGGGVVFDHCWAYDNGRLDGNKTGFKIGGFGASGGSFPSPPPVHTVQFCLSANNGANGFYANHQPGQAATWLNNTAYNNRGANFNMLEAIDTTPANASVPGTREVLHNNVAYVGTGMVNLDESGGLVSHNWFTLPVSVTAADFVSVDASQMTWPRTADGSLPDIAFMHLAAGSDLIDAGLDLGVTYTNAAPDLGAFETAGPATVTYTAPYAGGTILAGDTVRLNDGASLAGAVANQGTLQFNSSRSLTLAAGLLSGTGGLVLTNTGTLVIAGSNALAGPTTVRAGALCLAHPLALPRSTITVAAGGTMTVAAGVSATVGGLGEVDGVIDVGTGRLTVAGGMPSAAVAAALVAGRGDGSWGAPAGITSSAVAVAVARGLPRAVGWIDAGGGAVTFAAAAPGDTNLDGGVDILDAANFFAAGRFDAAAASVTWSEGDFNYDGVVDILDIADFITTGLFDAGPYGTAAAVVAVPEPAAVAWIGGMLALAVRYGSRFRAAAYKPAVLP